MSDASPPPAGRSPFNIWWALSGGLLLLVIIAAVAFGVSSLLPQGDDDSDGAPAPSDTSSAAPSSPASPVGETCNLDASDQSIPVVGPEAEWETFGYFLYPTSDVYGPTEDPAGSEWGCFAHNPTGALFAAANFFRAYASDDYATAVPDAAVHNPALDSWLSETADRPTGQTAGRVAQIAGFQYMSVEPDEVTLRLLFAQDDLNAYLTFGMAWDDARETWLGDFSQSNVDPVVADSIDSFTSWTAVNDG